MKFIITILLPNTCLFLALVYFQDSKYFDTLKIAAGVLIGSSFSFFLATLQSTFQETLKREKEYINLLSALEIIIYRNISRLIQTKKYFTDFIKTTSENKLTELFIPELTTDYEIATGILNLELKRNIIDTLQYTETLKLNIENLNNFYKKNEKEIIQLVKANKNQIIKHAFNHYHKLAKPYELSISENLRNSIEYNLESLAYIQLEVELITPSWLDTNVYGYKRKTTPKISISIKQKKKY